MNRDRMSNKNRRSAADGGSGGGSEPNNQGGRQRGRNRPASAGRRPSWFLRHKVLSVVFLVVLLCGIAGTGFALHEMNVYNNPLSVLQNRTPEPTSDVTDDSDTDTPDATDAVTPGDTTTNVPTATDELPPDYNFTANCVNFLILGTDSGNGRTNVMGGTDCMILISFNVVDKTAALVSIPRDTYVKIYSNKNKVVGRNRINSAFNYGGGAKKNGIAYAENTINQFMAKGKLPIDHYVLFDMDLVTKLIDAVGGVDIAINNLNVNSMVINGITYRNNTTMHMSGYQALTYARDRHHTSGGDVGRGTHQQDVMKALLKKLQDKGNIIKNVGNLYSALSGNFTTDLSDLDQLLAIAGIAKDMNIDNIKQYTLQEQGFGVNGASMTVADQAFKAQIVLEVFGIPNAADGSWTYSNLKGEITAKLNASKAAVTNAESYLSNNAGYYTDSDAADLRAAIATWNADNAKSDTDGCDDAAAEILTQLDIFKGIVEPRRTAISTGLSKISWAKGLGLSGIDDKIAAVQTCVDNKDYTDIGAAITALENAVKAATPAATDAPTDSPATTSP